MKRMLMFSVLFFVVLFSCAGLAVYISRSFVTTEPAPKHAKGAVWVESLTPHAHSEPSRSAITSSSVIESDTESFAELLHYQSPEPALNWLAERLVLGELSPENQIAYVEAFLARLEQGYFAPEEVVNFLAQFESDEEIFHLLASRVISTWSNIEPQAVLAWLVDYGDHPVAAAVSHSFGASLGQQDNAEIMAVHLVNSNESNRNTILLNELLRSWVSRAPEQALEFMLTQVPQSSFDSAKLEYVYRYGADQPQQVMALASGITDNQLRLEAIVSAARVWHSKSPLEYDAWYTQQAQLDAAIVDALARPGIFSESALPN